MDEYLTRDDGAGSRGVLGDAPGSTLALADASAREPPESRSFRFCSSTFGTRYATPP